ncbi:hypothetical protein [Sphingobacterium sp.]|uniref:hypothetical protein n=1 Tax=Sphingobacterium sp. TaxID=341027 RepID=UPI0028AB7ABE|nr:hypothetical protein [Sphingobacterium sp.]
MRDKMTIKSFKEIKAKFENLVSKFSFKSSNVGETVYEYTANEVGTEVYVSTSTGSELAPDGTVELPNGDSFIVTDGKISEVLTVANEENEEELKAEESEEKKAEDSKEEAIDLIIEGVDEEKDKEDLADEVPTEDNKEVEQLKAEIEALKATIKELKGEFSKEIDTKIEEFKAILKNTPASFSKQNTVAEDVKEDKWASLAKRFA